MAAEPSTLVVTPEVRDAMFAHALDCAPLEACGLVSAERRGGVVDGFHPVANAAASSTRFTLDPKEMLAAEAEIDAAGRVVVGVAHSHPATTPYPSPTDVDAARIYDPSGAMRQIIVSLRHAEPAMRCFVVADGTVAEVRIVVAGQLRPVDDPEPEVSAVAAAIALKRPSPPM